MPFKQRHYKHLMEQVNNHYKSEHALLVQSFYKVEVFNTKKDLKTIKKLCKKSKIEITHYANPHSFLIKTNEEKLTKLIRCRSVLTVSKRNGEELIPKRSTNTTTVPGKGFGFDKVGDLLVVHNPLDFEQEGESIISVLPVLDIEF